MLTTAIQANVLYSYTARHTQYDRLSQQQLSFLFIFLSLLFTLKVYFCICLLQFIHVFFGKTQINCKRQNFFHILFFFVYTVGLSPIKPIIQSIARFLSRLASAESLSSIHNCSYILHYPLGRNFNVLVQLSKHEFINNAKHLSSTDDTV